MSGRYAAVVFFVPLENRPASEEALLEAVGYDHASQVFGPLIVEEVYVAELEFHVQVWLAVAYGWVLDLVSLDNDLPLERDPGAAAGHCVA